MSKPPPLKTMAWLHDLKCHDGQRDEGLSFAADAWPMSDSGLANSTMAHALVKLSDLQAYADRLFDIAQRLNRVGHVWVDHSADEMRQIARVLGGGV
jgi:hypothetical protein